MNYLDEFAVRCLRNAARNHLWATPEWGELFEDDDFALGFVMDELRHAVREDFLNPSGNFDAALDLADTIVMGFINSQLVRFTPRPQGFRKQPRALKTGLQGRPTSGHLILVEFMRRCREGQVLDRLAAEARYLSDWLQKTYPGDPQPVAKTVTNHIRGPYNKHKAGNPVVPKSHK